MNKSIYTLINAAYLYPEAQYSSYDKSFLEEIMCDEFMLDVMYEFYYRKYDIDWETACRSYNIIWEDMLNYYNAYVSIIMSDII